MRATKLHGGVAQAVDVLGQGEAPELAASSVAAPKTNFDKVVELFFDIWAITVVATVAGSFGAFFHTRSNKMDGELDRAESRLGDEVEQLRERL
jgi:hypothetical protein